jgi:hypothetical protein
MEEEFDYNSFAFRNTTVDKFYKNVKKMNAPKMPNVNSLKRQTSGEGAAGTVFKTKKPEIKA